MFRTPLLSLATLAALCAAASVQAQAPNSQGSHSAQAKTTTKVATKTTQAKATAAKKTSYTAHQKSCMGRYKSYNASSDTYLLKGKKVRCKL
jgi:hypothetical protein